MTVRFRRRGASSRLGRAFALSYVALGPIALLAAGGCGSVLGIGEVDPVNEGPEGSGGGVGEGGAGPHGSGAAGAPGEGGRAGVGGGASGAPLTGGMGGAGGTGTGGGGTGGNGAGGVGEPAGAGGGSGLGGGGLGGAGGGGCPSDTFEPNELPAQATGLGAIDSCQGNKQVSAILSDPDDEDWFSVQGKVGVCLRADPKASLAIEGPARLCYYLKPNSALDFGCATGIVDESTVPGFKGCCADDSVAFIYEGPLSDPPASILLRVSPRASFNVCFPYTVTYDF